MARTEYLTDLRQDVGYAMRMLRRTPGFTLAALITQALGIGAGLASFLPARRAMKLDPASALRQG